MLQSQERREEKRAAAAAAAFDQDHDQDQDPYLMHVDDVTVSPDFSSCTMRHCKPLSAANRCKSSDVDLARYPKRKFSPAIKPLTCAPLPKQSRAQSISDQRPASPYSTHHTTCSSSAASRTKSSPLSF